MTTYDLSMKLEYYEGHPTIYGVYPKYYYNKNKKEINQIVEGNIDKVETIKYETTSGGAIDVDYEVTSGGSINLDYSVASEGAILLPVSELDNVEKTQIIVKMKDEPILQESMPMLMMAPSSIQTLEVEEPTIDTVEEIPNKELEQKLEAKLEEVEQVLDKKALVEAEKKEAKAQKKDEKKQEKTAKKEEKQVEKKKAKVEKQIGEIQVIEIDESYDVEEFIEELEADPEVEFAQPNYKLNLFSSEPLYSDQWALKNTGQTVNGAIGNVDQDINLSSSLEYYKRSWCSYWCT